MEEQTLDISDYISALKRRKTSILVIALTIFTVGALSALLWPATYKSSATILIKEQDIPPDLVRSTVTSFAAQRIQSISQKVMARPNLLEIIEKYNLYVEDKTRLTTEEIIKEMRDNIRLDLIDANVVDPRTGRPTSATIAFQLGFTGEHPGQVQKVANELMSLYLKENLKERSDKANETSAFLRDESERLTAEMADLEKALAEFKETNINSLPELRELNQSQMERAEREISDIDTQIRSHEQTKVYLQSQLAQLKPYGSNIALDPKTRLQGLRTEYLALVARYSADHPDVIRAKREIAALEQETGQVDSAAERLQQIDSLKSELATLKKKYSAEHPDVIDLEKRIKALQTTSLSSNQSKLASSASDNPDNPAYIQIQTQIEAADQEIQSLRVKQKKLGVKKDEYEQRLIATPQVEREYRELQRELALTSAEYQDIHTKLVSAQIAQELEKDSKGERFEIVEPPAMPEEPISPNRPSMLFLSLVLALVAGVGFAAVAESMDNAIRGSKSIAMAVGTAPLAVIPYMASDTEVRKSRRRTTTQVTAAAAAVILVIAMVHFFWKPLDVLWYKALRKADVVINT